jgi:hypothetical protein
MDIQKKYIEGGHSIKWQEEKQWSTETPHNVKIKYN